MLSKIFGYIETIHPVSSGVAEALEKSFEIVEYPKRCVMIREGDTCNYLYIVLSGLVRMYYIKGAEEICSLFVEQDHFFTVPNSFYRSKPGYQYVETVEASQIARLHRDRLNELYREFPELNFVARVITERYFVKSEERLYLIRKQTAEERYLYFAERYPTLLQRVPLKFIASYLGMTLETLSRMRSKIRK